MTLEVFKTNGPNILENNNWVPKGKEVNIEKLRKSLKVLRLRINTRVSYISEINKILSEVCKKLLWLTMPIKTKWANTLIRLNHKYVSSRIQEMISITGMKVSLMKR